MTDKSGVAQGDFYQEFDNMSFGELAQFIYRGNKERGFWDNDRSIGEVMMLIVTEVIESFEAETFDPFPDVIALREMHGDEWVARFKVTIKRHRLAELADVFIRILDLFGRYGIDATSIMDELAEAPSLEMDNVIRAASEKDGRDRTSSFHMEILRPLSRAFEVLRTAEQDLLLDLGLLGYPGYASPAKTAFIHAMAEALMMCGLYGELITLNIQEASPYGQTHKIGGFHDFIAMKLWYNGTRGYKHGKQF